MPGPDSVTPGRASRKADLLPTGNYCTYSYSVRTYIYDLFCSKQIPSRVAMALFEVARIACDFHISCATLGVVVPTSAVNCASQAGELQLKRDRIGPQ
jgi:hypothetical protein